MLTTQTQKTPAPAHTPHHPRRIALFGGSFDPIHSGHMAVARAADRRFHFDEMYLIPCGRPPQRSKHELAPYPHRFAMVSLACADHPHFIPSLAEAGSDLSGRQMFYSIDTVRHFRHIFHRREDKLYLIVGADSFLKIASWHEYEALLNSCDFVVASRPGFQLDALRLVIPPDLQERSRPSDPPDSRAIHLRRATVHLLDSVASEVSATEVRRRLDRGESVHGLVPLRVEEYISKQALYR